ncbi:MAG: family transcriptional regulator protein [Rickettsiales bacterium]|jgi:transcriptional regulator with XRE-family HTH domain|nr:family transcriptional regulator protein [Rickettsiales bacterium]
MPRKTISTSSPADIVLGQRIRELRMDLNLSQIALGRKINVMAQQIDKYEKGAFVPITVLEELAEALGIEIPKKIIRKIVFARKLVFETGGKGEDLPDLYREALASDDGEILE